MLSKYLIGEVPLLSKRDGFHERNQRGSRPMSKQVNVLPQEAADHPSPDAEHARLLPGLRFGACRYHFSGLLGDSDRVRLVSTNMEGHSMQVRMVIFPGEHGLDVLIWGRRTQGTMRHRHFDCRTSMIAMLESGGRKAVAARGRRPPPYRKWNFLFGISRR
jgi:hypothetical protein